jgi:uncharacterized protein YxjI
MQYPLQLSFKLLALAPQIYVRDSTGTVRMYVKQKLMKLKEQVVVFASESMTQELYHIRANKVIDWSAQYNFTTPDGTAIGAVRRKGMRSLWKAHYEIMNGDQLAFNLREENPWAKVGDALFSEIPVLGIFAGYVFHPKYIVTRPDGQVVMRASKQPAFMEGKYAIDKLAELTPEEEGVSALSILMLLLLERRRG